MCSWRLSAAAVRGAWGVPVEPWRPPGCQSSSRQPTCSRFRRLRRGPARCRRHARPRPLQNYVGHHHLPRRRPLRATQALRRPLRRRRRWPWGPPQAGWVRRRCFHPAAPAETWPSPADTLRCKSNQDWGSVQQCRLWRSSEQCHARQAAFNVVMLHAWPTWSPSL